MGDMLAAIIQARMTSTRLPGKVLKEVMARPLLSYQIERLRGVRKIEKIIVATTTNREDDLIVDLCNREGVDFYRGSEDDVLDRYYQTAKKFEVEHIMRITSDCPLIDPEICASVIDVYFKTGADFVHTGLTFAEGVDCEILSFRSLERAWNEANLKSEREHLTLYLHNHPELFKKITLTNKTDDSRYRFTVDEQEDFLVVKAVLEGLYKKNAQPFKTDEIKKFLDTHEEIFRLNLNIVRNQGLIKSLKQDKTI